MERTNARTLTARRLAEPVDLAVIDVSFISLGLVLGPVAPRSRPRPRRADRRPRQAAVRGRPRAAPITASCAIRPSTARSSSASSPRPRARARVARRDRVADPRAGGQPRVPRPAPRRPGCADIARADRDGDRRVTSSGSASPTTRRTRRPSSCASGPPAGARCTASTSGRPRPATSRRSARSSPTTDVLVVLGGDGTFLRAARAVIEVDVPLLGHQPRQGRLPVEGRGGRARGRPRPARRAASSRSTSGWRSRPGILPGGRTTAASRDRALNDVVDRPRGARPRRPARRRDRRRPTSRRSSPTGSSSSSPTGSTGYSFSAGGPIVEPDSRNLIVTPIAGYLSAIRSVVVGPDQIVRCRVVDAHEAIVSIDGRDDIPIAVGDVVEVRALERPIRLIEPAGASPSGTCSAGRSSCCRHDGRSDDATVADAVGARSRPGRRDRGGCSSCGAASR